MVRRTIPRSPAIPARWDLGFPSTRGAIRSSKIHKQAHMCYRCVRVICMHTAVWPADGGGKATRRMFWRLKSPGSAVTSLPGEDRRRGGRAGARPAPVLAHRARLCSPCVVTRPHGGGRGGPCAWPRVRPLPRLDLQQSARQARCPSTRCRTEEPRGR